MVFGVTVLEKELGRASFLEARSAIGDPGEVFAAIIDHFFGQIGAIGGVAHQNRLL